MRISEAAISMASEHMSSQSHKISESLEVVRSASTNTMPNHSIADSITISQEALQMAGSEETSAIEQAAVAAEQDPRTQLLRALIETLTGCEVKILRIQFKPIRSFESESLAPSSAAAMGSRMNQGEWGVEYHRHEVRQESEQTVFQAQGAIKTIEGQEIQFEFTIEMTRHSKEESHLDLVSGTAAKKKKDPLVLNFDHNLAQLSEFEFAFDIDADGKTENIRFVGNGSGFLSLDKNNNNKIDNGSELFGTASGNGFADLAQYDHDHNGWIDENDAIYNQLRIWVKADAQHDTLITLNDAHVGAIALANLATPFEIKGAAPQTFAEVQASGIYVTNEGQIKIIQQIDWLI